jgi:peptide/nickel transport system substrate-binding protein
MSDAAASRRRGIAVTVGLAVALVCASVPTVAMDQTIRFSPGSAVPTAFDAATGVYEEGRSFDPLVCAEQPCIELLHNIFEPLVSVSSSQIIEPALATHWERLGDTMSRFTLRRGVTFHNGEPLDAEAVRFSLLRASKAYGATAWFPELERVDVVDSHRVDVVLKQPDSLFLYRLGHIGLVHPPKYFQQVGEAAFGKKPVGTGPFRFVRWAAPTREVHLEANPRYWRKGYPKVQGVVYAYMDSEQALELLIQGKLDLIRRLNPRKTTTFMQTGAGKVVKAWLPQLVLGPFNLLKPETSLRDPRVRQAINLAINREDLIRYGVIGNGRPLGGYTVPDDPNRAGLPPYRLDVSKARQLLEEAGHGQGLTLSILVAKQVPPQIENIIAVSLRQVGVAVQFKRVTEPEFLKEVFLPKFGPGATPSFDVVLFSMPAGTIFHSANVPMTLLYSRKPNESALRDRVLDELYEEALRTYEPGKASALWKRLEQYTYDQNLLLIGYQELAVFGAAQRLQFTPRTLMTFWDAFYEQ